MGERVATLKKSRPVIALLFIFHFLLNCFVASFFGMLRSASQEQHFSADFSATEF